MQKLRAALILMIIFVALASWYKNQKREEPAAITERTTPTATPADANAAPTAAPTTSPTPAASGALYIPQEKLTLVRECLAKSATLPRVNVTEKTTLEDVLRDLEAKPNSSKLNVHVKRTDGKEERMLVQPHEKAANQTHTISGNDLRVFDVDTEGLPIAKPFPKDLKRDSIQHAINSFIGNDSVTFRETRMSYAFEGGVATSVETNGQLTELQLNYGRTTLGCAWQNNSLNCACL